MSPLNRDSILVGAVRVCGVASGLIVLLIVGFVGWRAWPALHGVGLERLFADPSWHPIEGRFNLF